MSYKFETHIDPSPSDLPTPLYPCARGCGHRPAGQLSWFGGMRTEDGRDVTKHGWYCATCLLSFVPALERKPETGPGLIEYARDNMSVAIRRARLVKRPFIYVASPYTPTGPDHDSVREQRVKQAGEVAAHMIKNGIAAIAPIPFFEAGARAYHDGPIDPPEGYYDYDLRILKRCDATVVLTIEGWERSTGIDIEVRESLRLDMPVRLLMYDHFSSLDPDGQAALLGNIEATIIEQLEKEWREEDNRT